MKKAGLKEKVSKIYRMRRIKEGIIFGVRTTGQQNYSDYFDFVNIFKSAYYFALKSHHYNQLLHIKNLSRQGIFLRYTTER